MPGITTICTGAFAVRLSSGQYERPAPFFVLSRSNVAKNHQLSTFALYLQKI
jgi:hypothetical protein